MKTAGAWMTPAAYLGAKTRNRQSYFAIAFS
jgi:hypothetical protein